MWKVLWGINTTKTNLRTLQKTELRVYTRRILLQSNREQMVDLSQSQSNSLINDSANPGNIHSPSYKSPNNSSNNFPSPA